jgi:hypothetical protein
MSEIPSYSIKARSCSSFAVGGEQVSESVRHIHIRFKTVYDDGNILIHSRLLAEMSKYVRRSGERIVGHYLLTYS